MKAIDVNCEMQSERRWHALLRISVPALVRDSVRIAPWLGILFLAGYPVFSQTIGIAYTHDTSGNLISRQVANVANPVILAQPRSQVVEPNGTAAFAVTVADASSITYQWKFNGTDISGATGDSLFLTTVIAANEGSYTVVITNPSGSVTSTAATLYVDSNGNGLPDSWEFAHFGNLNQAAGGDFDNDCVSNLDEYLEGTDPASNTSLFPRLKLISMGGTVTVSPLLQKYTYGLSVTLTATPYPGYAFVGWGGDQSGAASSVAITMNGNKTVYAYFNTVVHWGSNANNVGVVPTALSSVVAIAAGGYHTLALFSDGTVTGWGSGSETQIPAGLSNVVAIAAGDGHSLALKSDGTVVGWGSNVYGQTTIPAGLNNVVAIAAGTIHSLALKSDGTVVGWGNNGQGQTTIPAGLNNVVAIAASNHSLALKSDGTVVGWGYNNYGQATVPVGLSNVVAIAAGGGHSLALKSDGTVAGWSSSGYATPPAGLNNVVAIAAGSSHNSLALKSDGSVVGWGLNGSGEATPPPGLGNVIAIAAGEGYSLALINLFEAWKQLYWSNRFVPDAASFADPDGDGIVNAMEFSLNMVPTIASRAGLPTVIANGTNLDFTFYRARSDVTYEVQESTDLQTWTTVANNPGTAGTSVTISVPKGASPQKFLRLKVTLGQ